MIVVKAILVDDEPLALDFLERQLNKVSDISIVRKFTNFNIDKDATLLEEVDVVFLDIEMPEINGLQLAEKLLEIKPTMIIIFVTAFHEYAVQAFELNTLDYIVKPVQLDRLETTLDRIEEMISYLQAKPLSDNSRLQINVCRELSFEITKGDFEVVQWRTAKAKELFLYLLLHAGKTLRKDELAELLWPEAELTNDYTQLYTAIYHVRNTLKTFRNHFSLKNITDGYYLSIKNVSIDIIEWKSSIQSAPPLDIRTVADYEKIMDLYTGAYLQAYDYLWAEPERYRLDILWLKTAHQMADCYLQHNDLEKAETWYAKICNLSPEDENAHFFLMKIYDDLGYGMLVDHQFSQLKNSLKEFNIQVSPHVQKWYNHWSKNRKKIKN